MVFGMVGAKGDGKIGQFIVIHPDCLPDKIPANATNDLFAPGIE